MLSSILVFLVVLSVLILVHEAGHFIAARRAGVWVEEFGVGLPPRLVGKKVGETIYSINLLPFGGFVRLHGENTAKGLTKPKRAFLNKDKRKRVSIIVAGVLMNFILAIGAFALVYFFTGVPREGKNVRVVGVSQDSPAHEAGLVTEDIVRLIGGENIASVEHFIDVVEKHKGELISLGIERKGEEGLREFSLTPREKPPEGEGPVGVAITAVEIYYPPIWQRPFVGVYYGFREAIFWGGAVIAAFAKIITDLFSGVFPKDIAGPVGIFAITSEAASFGILAVINFVGILSVNLAILNLLPFPALDGGRLLFIGIESVFGRKIVPKVEAVIHTVGMVILLMLLLAITVHDVRRLISAGSISQFLDSALK